MLLDGQVLLSRSLADAAHYPAIDLNGSISRLCKLSRSKKNYLGSRFRRLWSLYQQNEVLLRWAHTNPGQMQACEAIRARDKMISFLRQDLNQAIVFKILSRVCPKYNSLVLVKTNELNMFRTIRWDYVDIFKSSRNDWLN